MFGFGTLDKIFVRLDKLERTLFDLETRFAPIECFLTRLDAMDTTIARELKKPIRVGVSPLKKRKRRANHR